MLQTIHIIGNNVVKLDCYILLALRKIIMNKLLKIIMIYLIALPLLAFANIDNKQISSLSVRGEAKISAPADTVNVNISIVSIDDSAVKAMDKNSSKMNVIFSQLKNIGLKDKEISTSNYNINPNYKRITKISIDYKPEIVNYTLTNTISIKTKKMDKIGEILQACANSGANKINSIVFEISMPEKYKIQALTKASKNAQEIAQTLARSLNVKINKTLNVSIGSIYAEPYLAESANMMMKSYAATSPKIANGNIIFNANVNVKYAIKDIKNK